ncbi:MAG: hypothetical protein NUW12_06895 [Firmicutes bacterium]|jgi:hypothetical protein|nr:hypothetical protein [Bacillota bacterium]MDH7495876.1 hypothetical protein [Bacillota bacterium]
MFFGTGTTEREARAALWWRAAPAVLLCAALLSLAGFCVVPAKFASYGPVSGSADLALTQSPANDPDIGRGGGFVDWLRRDVEYLKSLGSGGGSLVGSDAPRDRASLTRELSRDIERLRQEIARLDGTPSYVDGDLGFSVYDTDATGWLHVMSVAMRTREDLAAALGPPIVWWIAGAPDHVIREAALRESACLYRLNDGTPLLEADPSRLPRVDEVVSTLRVMDLPPAAFAGYRVYLLPFSMGDLSGLGAEGYALVGAAAAGRDVIANQVPVTVAHEFGHHVQMRALGGTFEADPEGWERYMKLRGIRRWTADGCVNTEAWARSPEETFAEDVRVLFGPPSASQEPHGTAYADPRTDPELATKLRRFIATRAAERAGEVAGSPWRSARGGRDSTTSSLSIVRALLRSCYERIVAGS